MSKPTFSGWHGLLILPDEETAKRAEELGRNYPAAEYRVQASGAHIPLYQAYFKDVPWDFVEGLVEDLRRSLLIDERVNGEVGISFKLNSLHAHDLYHGDRYLLWHLLMVPPLLQLAHRAALSLTIFLDRNLHHKNIARDPALSDDEYENVRQYGSAFAGSSFRPHITIAANLKGVDKPDQMNSYQWVFAERVVFARMKTWGQIEEILL